MKGLGQQIIAEFYNCDSSILKDTEMIETYMKRAAIECGATIVQSAFHTFNPFGVSGVVVIAESHLTIHTWPEYNYAAVDVFTCGDVVDPQIAIDSLKKSLKAQDGKFTKMMRGELDNFDVLHHKPVEVKSA